MRAIGSIRVSTEDQAAEGVSLEAHQARIRAGCQANSASIDDGDLDTDAGLSGTRADNRSAPQAARDAVGAARGVLVVYSLSRLARSTRDTLTIAERLGRSGADRVSLSERIDTTRAPGMPDRVDPS